MILALLILALLILALLLMPLAPARGETCRFAGSTSHDGRLAATVTTTQNESGALTVDVAVDFTVTALLHDVRYDGEEVSVWRGGALVLAGVNQRTRIDGAIKRQQWDVFERRGAVLQAWRVQAKRLEDFAARHPGFVSHWAPASFGRAWLPDYQAAQPDRRPDLDLPAAATARVPLALAFYWSRFLPDAGGATPLVLPGFKRDKVTELQFGAPVAGDGWRRWSAPLVHPGLERRPVSLAAVWVSPQNYLLQLGFEVHTDWASGQAVIRPLGCQGVQIRP